jgi:hypothetical protein
MANHPDSHSDAASCNAIAGLAGLSEIKIAVVMPEGST